MEGQSCLNVLDRRNEMAMVKLMAHYLRRGYGPRVSFKLARNRYNDTNLARRMIEQNVFGRTK